MLLEYRVSQLRARKGRGGRRGGEAEGEGEWKNVTLISPYGGSKAEKR
jgi:hypothetical protein